MIAFACPSQPAGEGLLVCGFVGLWVCGFVGLWVCAASFLGKCYAVHIHASSL